MSDKKKKQEEIKEKEHKNLDLLFRKYQVEMRKVQEQGDKLSKHQDDDKRREEHLKKRKEQWEEKLKKK